VVRTTTWWSRPDGASLLFGGRTDAVTGAQLQTLIDAHSAPRSSTDPGTGVRVLDRRTAEQRRGEAFAQLVRLAANADDTTSGTQPVQLVVTTTLETLRAAEGQAGVAPAATETGAMVSAAWVRRLACDARVIPAVLGSAGEVLDIGRQSRVVPAGIRRALVLRDKGCTFPGCGRPPRWADAHHVVHWSRGGPTSLDNLVLLCELHHQVVHHTLWQVAIVDDLPVFTAPNGHSPPRRLRQ
jgi:hypothetical protein